MPHLVDSLSSESFGGEHQLTLRDCIERISAAHDFLVVHALKALKRAAEQTGVRSWGRDFKRNYVQLPRDGRPELVRKAADSQSLVELVNQCATMERLLDALEWAQLPESGLADCVVKRCHPTTSSDLSEADDHDLVLSGPNSRAAWFEVSDVASSADSNRKEERDLISLGLLLPKADGQDRRPQVWPSARVFLVVSKEFSKRLTKSRWAHLRYEQHDVGGSTVVVECLEVPMGAQTPST